MTLGSAGAKARECEVRSSGGGGGRGALSRVDSIRFGGGTKSDNGDLGMRSLLGRYGISNKDRAREFFRVRKTSLLIALRQDGMQMES